MSKLLDTLTTNPIRGANYMLQALAVAAKVGRAMIDGENPCARLSKPELTVLRQWRDVRHIASTIETNLRALASHAQTIDITLLPGQDGARTAMIASPAKLGYKNVGEKGSDERKSEQIAGKASLLLAQIELAKEGVKGMARVAFEDAQLAKAKTTQGMTKSDQRALEALMKRMAKNPAFAQALAQVATAPAAAPAPAITAA